MAGARSTSSRKTAAQASQTIIAQISIVPPEVLLFSRIAEDSSAASAQGFP
jgi:methionine salvage enolase-phosphatase E1